MANELTGSHRPVEARTAGRGSVSSVGHVERVFFTSQVGQVFCVDVADGKLAWHQPAEVHGHSAPAVDTACGQGHLTWCGEGEGEGEGEECMQSKSAYTPSVVSVGAVDGSVHVFSCTDGQPLATLKLPAAIFSSPAICASRVLVGSRDDRLYCLELRERCEVQSEVQCPQLQPDVGKRALSTPLGKLAGDVVDDEGESGIDPHKLAALRKLLGMGR